MKNNLKKIIKIDLSFGNTSEYYINFKGKKNGLYTKFYLSENKFSEGQFFKDNSIGVWKSWTPYNLRYYIFTHYESVLNGIRIKFK